jgi:hypothetical protein
VKPGPGRITGNGRRHRRQATRRNVGLRSWFLCRTSERSRTERLVYTKPDPTLSEIGARLALTRRALTLTRFQTARLLGTDMPTWGT